MAPEAARAERIDAAGREVAGASHRPAKECHTAAAWQTSLLAPSELRGLRPSGPELRGAKLDLVGAVIGLWVGVALASTTCHGAAIGLFADRWLSGSESKPPATARRANDLWTLAAMAACGVLLARSVVAAWAVVLSGPIVGSGLPALVGRHLNGVGRQSKTCQRRVDEALLAGVRALAGDAAQLGACILDRDLVENTLFAGDLLAAERMLVLVSAAYPEHEHRPRTLAARSDYSSAMSAHLLRAPDAEDGSWGPGAEAASWRRAAERCVTLAGPSLQVSTWAANLYLLGDYAAGNFTCERSVLLSALRGERARP